MLRFRLGIAFRNQGIPQLEQRLPALDVEPKVDVLCSSCNLCPVCVVKNQITRRRTDYDVVDTEVHARLRNVAIDVAQSGLNLLRYA